MYDYKIQYPFKIGTNVKWGSKEGKVTAIAGPYSVVVDNRITVPVCLITSPKLKRRTT